MIPYEPPARGQSAFNCVHCHAYAKHHWYDAIGRASNMAIGPAIEHVGFDACDRCGKWCIWVDNQLVFPPSSAAPPPNADLPADVKADYEEASAILARSPRGAAALLRLGIQKLCKHLGEKGDNANDDIASLVKKGLPVMVQQALDVVRVVGNHAVHPGVLDLKDDTGTATSLFGLVNVIVEVMISQPKQIASLYENLPAAQRVAIAKRDS